MTPQDFIYGTYEALFNNGWTMNDVDNMDMIGYLRVKAWSCKQNPAEKRVDFIDDIM